MNIDIRKICKLYYEKEVLFMTYKQIEASREARLWIGQVIVPAIVGGIMIVTTNPEVQGTIANKVDKVKQTIKSKFKK